MKTNFYGAVPKLIKVYWSTPIKIFNWPFLSVGKSRLFKFAFADLNYILPVNIRPLSLRRVFFLF